MSQHELKEEVKNNTLRQIRKHNHKKSMECSKSNSKTEVYSNARLPQKKPKKNPK